MVTTEFDVELLAPIDMFVTELEHNTHYFRKLLIAPYYFKIYPLEEWQLEELQSEESYIKGNKIIL